MIKVLLVEDDKTIIGTLSEFLKSEGFEVVFATGQTEALKKAYEEKPDVVLLDVSLSEGNGFAVCSAIKKDTAMPVIFLTASGDEFSVVTGFDLGADDYISKPFRPRELVSRIKNVLRRTSKASTIITLGNIEIDTDKATVKKDGADIFLSALEYKLFLVFLNNRGAVLSRNALLSELWDISGEFVNDNTLTVYIKRLREKIEKDPQEPEIIMTVRGLGYKVGE